MKPSGWRLRAPPSTSPAGAGSPGSGRSAGRTRCAPWRSCAALRIAARPKPDRLAPTSTRSGFMPCRMYSKPLPSSPIRSARHVQVVDEQRVGLDRLAAHLRDLARLDLSRSKSVEQAEAFGAALDLIGGVVRARISILVARCAVESRSSGPRSRSGRCVRTALVLSLSVSSPTFGSVTAKHALSCPAISGGSNAASAPRCRTSRAAWARRCSGGAPGARKAGARLRHGLHHDRRLGHAQARPPNCSGMPTPSQPASAKARGSRAGTRRSRRCAASIGVEPLAEAQHASRIACCSAVKAKSMRALNGAV